MKSVAVWSVAVLLVAAVSADIFDGDFDDGWHRFGAVYPQRPMVGGVVVSHGVSGGPLCKKHGGMMQHPIATPYATPIVTPSVVHAAPVTTTSYASPIMGGSYIQSSPYASGHMQGSYATSGFGHSSPIVSSGLEYGISGSYPQTSGFGGEYLATSGMVSQGYAGGMQSFGQQFQGVAGGNFY